jgi:hypothetical protein
MRGRPVCVVSVLIAIAAAVFWVAAGLATWGGIGHAALAFEVGAGTALSVIAALCRHDAERAWQDRERARLDRDRELLIRTLADAVPPRPLAKTMPFPRAL